MSKSQQSHSDIAGCSRQVFSNTLRGDSCEMFERENQIDITMLPDKNNSDIESGSDSDTSDVEEVSAEVANILSYKKVYESYSENQKYLEPNHKYEWVLGAKNSSVPANEYLLKDSYKKMIRKSSPCELFETFFSTEMKNHIIDSSFENDLKLSVSNLNIYIAIIILTSFNKRTTIKDYWSTDPLLECPIVRSAISRNRFLEIQSKIKYSKKSELHSTDPTFRVRTIFELFRKNIKKFGFFETALAVDEMMIKFFGRLKIKQYIRNKPVRFGIKVWALCGADGFVFDCDIYRGKNVTDDGILSNCALGSRVVIQLLQPLLMNAINNKLSLYHLYCDNFFTSRDLFLHLKNIGLKATGVVRKDRVKEKNELDKKASRGTYIVKNDKNSGMNFITLMDSKEVSILSTAAGVEPQKSVKRYSKTEKNKVDINLPAAFAIYNKYMGGVDLHDQYCSSILPSMRSKKWTFSIFVRLIQSSLTNAVIIFNSVQEERKKMPIKEFAMCVSREYLQKAELSSHELSRTEKQRSCGLNCGKRSYWFCEKCDHYLCKTCSSRIHNN